MKKEDFIKILDIFEYTEMITVYNFLIKENAIKVSISNEWGTDYDYTYYFDENDILIHPQAIDIRAKIKKLEQEKQEYEETLKKLLILNN